MGGGGAQKIIMCVLARHKREAQRHLRQSVQDRKEALGFSMLSHAIWALFLSILIQNGIIKKK